MTFLNLYVSDLINKLFEVFIVIEHNFEFGDVIIRNAEREDAEKLLEYINKISYESDFLSFGGGQFKKSVKEQEETIEDFTMTDNKLLIVAEINGVIIGSLNFYGKERPRTRHAGEFGVSVAKEYWGFGIGRQLINYLINWAKQSGVVRRIELIVREDNARGITLYKSLGFEREGFFTRFFYIDDKFFSAILMGMEID